MFDVGTNLFAHGGSIVKSGYGFERFVTAGVDSTNIIMVGVDYPRPIIQGYYQCLLRSFFVPNQIVFN